MFDMPSSAPTAGTATICARAGVLTITAAAAKNLKREYIIVIPPSDRINNSAKILFVQFAKSVTDVGAGVLSVGRVLDAAFAAVKQIHRLGIFLAEAVAQSADRHATRDEAETFGHCKRDVLSRVRIDD
jgi:hypothetical protein